jgi:hypothetical protein
MASVSVCNPGSSSFHQVSTKEKALPRQGQVPMLQEMQLQPGYLYFPNTGNLMSLTTGAFVPALNTFNNKVMPVARQATQQYAQQYMPTRQELGRSLVLTAVPYSSEVLAVHSAYKSLATEYQNTKELPIQERSKKLATKAGDVMLFTLLGTFALPALLATSVNRWVENNRTRMPAVMARNPKIVTAAALGMIGAVVAKPVNALVNWVMDWTYRPIVEEKRRKEFLAAQAELKKKALDFQQKAVAYQESMKRSHNTHKAIPMDTVELALAARGA